MADRCLGGPPRQHVCSPGLEMGTDARVTVGGDGVAYPAPKGAT